MTQPYRPPWKLGAGPIPRYVVQPTIRFMRLEAAGGIVLVFAAAAAVIWANAWSDSYHDVWFTQISIDLDFIHLDEPLEAWVNDALMAIFFFVVGMEIKREMVHGELREPRQAALPVMAAAGGMIIPAAIFLVFNAGGPGGDGWGIPVATDIAFALGVLSLAGNRVPVQLKIFLLTLAVADDIGGILIIAVFYTDDLALGWLAAAGGLIALILVMQRTGFRAIPLYVVVGGVLWLAVFESGVHATIAGVILGLLTPATALYNRSRTASALLTAVSTFNENVRQKESSQREDASHEALRTVEHLSQEALSPLERLEESVAPWSAFLVVPIFALANAGIGLSGGAFSDALSSDVAWGVALGLLFGKFVGVVLFTYLTVRLGVSVLPPAIQWPQIAAVSLLAGIGFTVAIFIAGLSYSDGALVESAKLGIFAASIIAAVLGFVAVRLTSHGPQPGVSPGGNSGG